MSGRPEEGIYGNLESQSSNVSQGGWRRARSEFESDTDYSSVSRRRLEGMHRPQWTMSSSVEDILLEGSTLRNNMKLNEFLRSNLGEEWVVERNGNVTMEAFVQEPDAYVQDQQFLRRIVNLTAYQELKIELEIELDNRKRELNERRILLEDINKLHHEGVFSLRQWRGFKSKNTVTPLAKGKLNAVLTQVQIEEKREAEEKRKAEEKREAEERLRREEDERQRRAQEMKFTISTTIEEVLFKGGVRVKEKKLNDFLTMELDGRGVVDTNRGVLLKEFFKDPARYIHDEGVLREIQTTDAYLRMERAVKGEIIFENDQSKLDDKGVGNLLGWSEAAPEVKTTVHNFTKQSLDAALEGASKPTTTIAPEKLEGYYESVYNARWHHVVEVSDGKGAGMYVREGEPPQSWTYKKVDDTLEKDDGEEQSGAPRPRLMVLTPDRGWPYSWKEDESTRDCHVNCELERVWRIVRAISPNGSVLTVGPTLRPSSVC
ncbi:putative retrotransposon hot spot protein (RHS) [Trypanosoma cruzi]|uniref:Putative retrotransposon hot spot protein (RHS) n=1 Tax=Trypanosoma cruzi TaxID=5693 RepID=A0A2V2UYQ2_TRYCR|nr:putative retrotransposon hot spot protein (RHS) [Trypanosoma cruzi]RNC33068.1 retrotransposon hot spot (RHS) protein [Trypanosoma cruzi]